MVTNEQMKRLEALEARARREDMRPMLEQVAAEHDLDVDELAREVWRIRAATEGMSRPEQKAWFVRDLAGSTSLTEDEALVEVSAWIAW